ncbi:6-bladed beta-propeller [uncultured Parabacteroides sp.]|uniref:6-bladed beta-propeller n=1 Tax=uncultured Parabacteroides sp. TaxID=512312 RepID=UPI0026175BA8|nr:6-bladed beta-propeller [uncultured Parabacteroides sp.]
MKNTNTILAILLLAISACGEGNKQATEIITVDVSTNYPEKEWVLQDIMDVEYVPLETTDEFITKGIVKAIGKDVLLVTNQSSDGDIFVFDRKNGKGLRKINRMGQGAEEYSYVSAIALDEEKQEMFVSDYGTRKIVVYDLSGNFKRSFKNADASYYNDLFNYDRNHLITYKSYSTPEENEQACHILISKQDGSIAREIRIPYKEMETPVVTKDEFMVVPEFHQTYPTHTDWMLVNTSSDTLYSYSPDGSISPLITRTPSIHAMETKIFLFPTVMTDRYYFMRAMKKEVSFKTFKGFPSTDLVYDKQDKTLSEYTLYNADYSNKQQVTLGLSFNGIVNHEIATCQSLEAAGLIEANEKGQLQGKLKEIASGLNEESNAVIMLVKYRGK